MIRKIKYVIYIITSVIILLCTLVPIFGKYITDKNTNIGINSKNFFFTVDLLGDTATDESLNKSYILAGGDSKEVSFYVQNFFDDYRICNVDVTYKVLMEIESNKSGYDTSLITLSKEQDTEYTISKTNKSDDKWTLNIPEGYGNNTIIKLTIISTKPYVKEMTLEFVCKTYDYEFSYELIDEPNNPIATLIIRTNVDIDINNLIIDFSTINESFNNLAVDITDEYLIDNIKGELIIQTNALSNGEEYYKKVVNTMKINAGEAIEIIFTKDDITKDYSIATKSANNESGKFYVVLE